MQKKTETTLVSGVKYRRDYCGDPVALCGDPNRQLRYLQRRSVSNRLGSPLLQKAPSSCTSAMGIMPTCTDLHMLEKASSSWSIKGIIL